MPISVFARISFGCIPFWFTGQFKVFRLDDEITGCTVIYELGFITVLERLIEVPILTMSPTDCGNLHNLVLGKSPVQVQIQSWGTWDIRHNPCTESFGIDTLIAPQLHWPLSLDMAAEMI